MANPFWTSNAGDLWTMGAPPGMPMWIVAAQRQSPGSTVAMQPGSRRSTPARQALGTDLYRKPPLSATDPGVASLSPEGPPELNRGARGGYAPNISTVPMSNRYAPVNYTQGQYDAPLRPPLDLGGGMPGAMPPADQTREQSAPVPMGQYANLDTPSGIPMSAGGRPTESMLEGPRPAEADAHRLAMEAAMEGQRYRARASMDQPYLSEATDPLTAATGLAGAHAPHEEIPFDYRGALLNAGVNPSRGPVLRSGEDYHAALADYNRPQYSNYRAPSEPPQPSAFRERSPREADATLEDRRRAIANVALSLQPETAIPMAAANTYNAGREAVGAYGEGRTRDALASGGAAVLEALGGAYGARGALARPGAGYAAEQAAAGRLRPSYDEHGVLRTGPLQLKYDAQGNLATHVTGEPGGYTVESPVWHSPPVYERPGGQLNTFLPVRGAARQEALDLARGGMSNEELWNQRQMFIGPEGIPRYMIPDAGRRFIGTPVGQSQPLVSVMPEHGDLFEAAPYLRGVSVRGTPWGRAPGEEYGRSTQYISPTSGEIGYSGNKGGKMYSNVQLLIQNQEGLAGSMRHRGNLASLDDTANRTQNLIPAAAPADAEALRAYHDYLRGNAEQVRAQTNATGVLDASRRLKEMSAGDRERDLVMNSARRGLTPKKGSQLPFPYAGVEASLASGLVIPPEPVRNSPDRFLEFIRNWYANPYRQAGGK